MQSMNVNGMQVIVLNQPGLQNEQLTHGSMKPRLAKQLIGLGVVHVLNGVFCIIFQSISLDKFVNATGWNRYTSLAMLGHGFWGGLPFLVTGIIGITAGIRKSNCQVVAFSILSIISAVLAAVLIIIAVISADMTFKYRRPYTYYGSTESPTSFYDQSTTIIVMDSMLAAMGILEGIISIWSSIVCCLIGVCNCCLAFPPQTQPMILSAEQQAALMSNPMFLPNQQQSTVGFNPQQQTVQFNKLQPNGLPYSHNNFMSAATVEGSYTGLNTGMRRNLPSIHMNASDCITTSFYEELHDYEEMDQAAKS